MARTKKHSARKHKSKKGGSVTNMISLSRPAVRNAWYNYSAKLGLKGGNPKKGQKSKTMKGKKDFTTKKSSKYFNRKGHRQSRAQGSKKHRRPFRKQRGGDSHMQTITDKESSYGWLFGMDRPPPRTPFKVVPFSR